MTLFPNSAAPKPAAPAHSGRIAIGHHADLLAVTGNAVDDITAIHNVVAVYRHGHRTT